MHFVADVSAAYTVRGLRHCLVCAVVSKQRGELRFRQTMRLLRFPD